MDIQKTDTAVVFIDPQNDVLSEKGANWCTEASAALPAAVRAPTIARSPLSGSCNAKTFRNRRDRCRPCWARDAGGGDGRAASG